MWRRKHLTSPEILLIKSCSIDMIWDKMSTRRANKLSLALSAISRVVLFVLELFLTFLFEWSSCKSFRASVWCFREPIISISISISMSMSLTVSHSLSLTHLSNEKDSRSTFASFYFLPDLWAEMFHFCTAEVIWSYPSAVLHPLTSPCLFQEETRLAALLSNQRALFSSNQSESFILIQPESFILIHYRPIKSHMTGSDSQSDLKNVPDFSVFLIQQKP